MLIWQFYNPKKAIIKGHVTLLRCYDKSALLWRYKPKDEEDVTEKDIKQAKISAATATILLTIVIIIIILMSNNHNQLLV